MVEAALLDAMTRADLVELARGRGLKASGWSKPRVLEELKALDAPAAMPTVESAPAAEVSEAAEGDDLRPPASGKTGWCSLVPAWSSSHERCVARRSGEIQCACDCHEESWTRPEPPAGSRFNRFYGQTGVRQRDGSEGAGELPGAGGPLGRESLDEPDETGHQQVEV